MTRSRAVATAEYLRGYGHTATVHNASYRGWCVIVEGLAHHAEAKALASELRQTAGGLSVWAASNEVGIE